MSIMSILKFLLKFILPKAEASVKPIFISFKTKRIEKEWNDLKFKNKDLYDLVEDLSVWVNKEMGKQLVLTMIYRTQEEQDYLYRNDKRYQQKKFKSPHQFGHAVDLRSRTFTKLEIIKIENYLNDKYDRNNYYKWTALCHDVGAGDHFHLQFFRK